MDKPRIHIERPGDLVALIPYLVGFVPHESVVTLVFDGSSLLAVVRCDLQDAWAVRDRRTQALLASCDEPNCVLVAFGEDAERCHDALARAETQLDPVLIKDSIVTDGGRWYSRLSQAASGCVPVASAPVATAILAGCAALGSRQELAASIQGPRGAAERRLTKIFRQRQSEWDSLQLSQRLGAMRELVANGVDGVELLAESDLIDLAILADEVAVRDQAWLLIDREGSRAHVELWRRVTSVAVDGYATAVLCLLGMSAWLSGNGALQACCITRAAGLEPDYSMLNLLEDLTARAVSPALWDAVSAGARSRSA